MFADAVPGGILKEWRRRSFHFKTTPNADMLIDVGIILMHTDSDQAQAGNLSVQRVQGNDGLHYLVRDHRKDEIVFNVVFTGEGYAILQAQESKPWRKELAKWADKLRKHGKD